MAVEGTAVGALPPIALEISSLLVPSPSGIAVFGNALLETFLARRGNDGAGRLVDDIRLVYRVGRRCGLLSRAARGLPASAYLSGAYLHRRSPLLHALDTRLPPAYRGRVVATLYDVLSALPISTELELAPPRFRAKKLEQYQRIAARADAIISISNETRRRFRETFDHHGPHAVIHPGVSPAFRPGAADAGRLARLGIADARYLLFVGELCRRKNLEGVVAAYLAARARRPDLRLVLVGRASFGWEGSEAQRLVEASDGMITSLGFVPLEDLAAVYAGATSFLYISHYEGFGLPVLEAMASGVPVVASSRGGIPEAAGDAAELVDPDDTGAVGRALERILDDPDHAGRLRQRGLDRATLFRWEHVAERVCEVYRNVLGDAAPGADSPRTSGNRSG